jgi:hypothetical protein
VADLGRAGSAAGLAVFLAGDAADGGGDGGAGRLADAPRDVRDGTGPPDAGRDGIPGHTGGTAPFRVAAPADLTAGGSGGADDPLPDPLPARAAGRDRAPEVVVPPAGVMFGHPAAPGLLPGNRSGGASLADAVPADAPQALARAAGPP